MTKRTKKKSEKNGEISGFAMFAFGLVFLIAIVLFPCWELFNSRDWVETDAVVESSRKGGYTYPPTITYKYRYENQHYTSTNYNFDSGHSSGLGAVIEQYPQGKYIKCYVNPKKPTAAVMIRGLGNMFWLRVLVPGALIGFGLWEIIATQRKKTGVNKFKE